MNSYSTSEGSAKSRLVDLARKSEGTASLSQIISAAGGAGDTINFYQAIPTITQETGAEFVQQGAQAFQNVGAGVLSGANLLKYLPWILGAGAVLYVYTVASRHGKSSAKLIDAAAERIRNVKKR
jgi:hypothetical protein